MVINDKMHLKFSFLSRFTALALLAGPSIAMAFSQGTLKRNLKLAAELGIDPNSILRGGKSVHALVQATNGISVTPEYVEVGNIHGYSLGRFDIVTSLTFYRPISCQLTTTMTLSEGTRIDTGFPANIIKREVPSLSTMLERLQPRSRRRHI